MPCVANMQYASPPIAISNKVFGPMQFQTLLYKAYTKLLLVRNIQTHTTSGGKTPTMNVTTTSKSEAHARNPT